MLLGIFLREGRCMANWLCWFFLLVKSPIYCLLANIIIIWTSSQTRVLQFLRQPELFTLVSDLRVSQTHCRFCAIWCRVYSLHHSYIAKSAKSHFLWTRSRSCGFRVVTLLQLQLRLRFHMQQRRLGHLQLDTQICVHLACGWKTMMTADGFQVSIPLAAIFIGSLGHLASKVNCIAKSFDIGEESYSFSMQLWGRSTGITSLRTASMLSVYFGAQTGLYLSQRLLFIAFIRLMDIWMGVESSDFGPRLECRNILRVGWNFLEFPIE